MLHHIILWKIKEDKSESEKAEIKKAVKEGLEALYGVVPQIKKIHVQIESLETSTCDIMLDSEFENAEALKPRQLCFHSQHTAVLSMTM